MSTEPCLHLTAHGIHSADFPGGYALKCADCGLLVPDPFCLTPAERLSLIAPTLQPIGMLPSGGFTEWVQAIDGDTSWINEQLQER